MKASELKNLIREEAKKMLTEASNPYRDKLDAIYTKIGTLNKQIDKVVDDAVKSVTLEIQGNKAVFTRKSDGKQFVTTKTSSSRSDRTIKDMKTGKEWGIVRNMTLEKIKFVIAMDDPYTSVDYFK